MQAPRQFRLKTGFVILAFKLLIVKSHVAMVCNILKLVVSRGVDLKQRVGVLFFSALLDWRLVRGGWREYRAWSTVFKREETHNVLFL